jgi:tRNA U34 5-methylaminomethyl-2-thiouridine-forming methyltransferase MnmC
MLESTSWTPQPTGDGSFTFFSSEFGEAFHSRQGAKAEAFLKFSQATHLAQKAEQSPLHLLDICYGLGYNTAAALETIWSVNPQCQVVLYGLELDSTVPQAAIEPPLLATWQPQIQTILKTLALEHSWSTPLLHAQVLIGDARQTIHQLIEQHFQAEAIFLDPFSPRCCPQLWTIEFCRLIAQCLAPTGMLATYSRAASVRSALVAAGLQIGTMPPPEKGLSREWSQGTIAGFILDRHQPLSLMEQEHLQTRAAIPYRDPTLSDSAAQILERHQQEQQTCDLESTSSWRRRWGIW